MFVLLTYQPLRTLLEFYNCGVAHLMHVVGDPNLQKVKWPAQEFSLPGLPPVNWNTHSYQNSLTSVIMLLL